MTIFLMSVTFVLYRSVAGLSDLPCQLSRGLLAYKMVCCI